MREHELIKIIFGTVNIHPSFQKDDWEHQGRLGTPF